MISRTLEPFYKIYVKFHDFLIFRYCTIISILPSEVSIGGIRTLKTKGPSEGKIVVFNEMYHKYWILIKNHQICLKFQKISSNKYLGVQSSRGLPPKIKTRSRWNRIWRHLKIKNWTCIVVKLFKLLDNYYLWYPLGVTPRGLPLGLIPDRKN